MAVRGTVSADGKLLTVEIDLNDEDDTKPSGSGNTIIIGGGPPSNTGAKYTYKGKKYDITVGANAWIPNPEAVAKKEAEKAAAKAAKAGKGGAAAKAAASAHK